MTWITTETEAGRLSLDPAIGNIRALEFRDGARRISPLHTAPWVDEEVPADMAPVERNLSGDFFCAPFGAGDVEEAPIHGWTANSAWTGAVEGGAIRCTLERAVMGAKVTKTLRLAPDAPLLYQVHEIRGGDGGLTVAHHPMVRISGRARATFSAKRAWLTPEAPPEPGRHRLAYPAEGTDLSALRAADGGTLDIGALPIGDSHEDFVTLVEAEGSALGWTAILREAEDDIVFYLKDPAVLPVTMLWHSNGGRDFAPWNGRHKHVLGVEDGCAAGSAGHRASLGPNPVSATGVPTALALGDGIRHHVAHVIGCIARPEGWRSVADISLDGDRLVLSGDDGGTRSLPFDASVFARVG